MGKAKRSNAKRAFTRWKNEIIKAATAGDDPEIINGRFAECKKLWLAVQGKHEAYIIHLDQKNEERMDAEESWLQEVQSEFLEVGRMKIAYLKSMREKTERSHEDEYQRKEQEK